MQSFGQDFRRAEQRRYLAQRRKIYGNAVSSNNMRNQPPVSGVPGFPVQPPLSSQNSSHGHLSTRPEISLSSAYSWQLGRCLHIVKAPQRRSSSPTSKEMPWPAADVPESQVRWSTVPEYEKLQKEALAKAKMASRVDEDDLNQYQY